MDFGLKTLAWYDRSVQTWIAVFHDVNDNQGGNCGYGSSKKDAIADVQYQREITGV